ncbi:MAG: DegT/DnrJ/EryC1/StrS family aminotransferase [Candidatus Omnitrophica bacterium]|nr:DegT/DnrJ/EryC1/StrS family aminotransferase [Candidatus Omnitrophota bacterium]
MPGYELVGKEERDAVLEIFDKHGGILFKHGFDALRNGSYKVVEFEKAFAKYLGTGYAQAVTSGTTALKVALEALRIKPGDEVITSSFTFVATVEAIIECGAIPVLTDVDETLNMDSADLERKITKKTKIIIPVHMYGAAAYMDRIMDIAKKHSLLVLEDTAQALGGEYKGKKLGTIGDTGSFSFDFGKALTTGEGGMVVSNRKDIYLKAREYADHGHENNPNFPRGEDTRRRRGFNCRMMELQGAIGLVQLTKLESAIQRQKENKKKIKDAIKDAGMFKFRRLADEAGETADTLVLIFDDIGNATQFVKNIREKGLGTKNLPDAFNWHFAGTWNHIFSELDYYKDKPCDKLWKRSEDLLRRAVALPINIKMSGEQIEKTVNIIKEALK